VNPSLSISAMAERFANSWPVRDGVSDQALKSRKIPFTFE